MSKNIIFVKDYISECYIGIYPNEKSKKQKIKITIKLFIKKLGNSDKISSTVSYDNILDALKKIDGYGHCNLVETLAIKLAQEFNDIKNIKKIKIKIVKCGISEQDTDVGFTLIKKFRIDGKS